MTKHLLLIIFTFTITHMLNAQDSSYYDNGKVKTIKNYKNGKLDGYYKEYGANGVLSHEATYISGNINGLTKDYREDGSIFSEGHLIGKEKHGLWKYYNTRGSEIARAVYEKKHRITEGDIILKAFNFKWFLSKKTAGEKTEYIFKREAIINKQGKKITPTIKIYAEDATGYPDVTIFSTAKKIKMKSEGIVIDEELSPKSMNYPIPIKNSILYKCHYGKNGQEHLFYMAYILTKSNKGIQLYMDIPKDLENDYVHEFKETLKGLEEL